MTVTGKLEPEIRGWVGIGILIVIGSILLLKFKTATCPTGYTFNTSTANTCYLTTNSSVTTDTGADLGTMIDTMVTGLSEPSSWVAIAVIALVGFAMFQYAKSKKN